MDRDLNMTVAPSRFTVKARYLVVLWLMSFVFVPGYSLFARLLNAQTASWYWYDLVYYSCLYGSLSILIAIQLLNSNVHFKGVLTKPASGAWWPSLLLTAVSFAFATAVFYGTFVPLSYLVPNFVQHWVIELPHLIYFTPDGYFPLWANVLSFVFIVVIPPCVEELIFRGILLHRWAYKYGTLNAVLWSSIIFGAVHTDPLGATVFGAVMCVVYLKSGSLWVPIVCHGANNFVCWLWEAWDISYYGLDYVYTLEAFRDELPWAAVAAIITLVLVAVYRKHPFHRRALALPKLTATD